MHLPTTARSEPLPSITLRKSQPSLTATRVKFWRNGDRLAAERLHKLLSGNDPVRFYGLQPAGGLRR